MMDRIRERLLALSGASAFAELSSDRFPPDAARRYRRDQIVGSLDQTQLLLLGNTLFAPILAYQGLPEGPLPLLIGWALLMVCGSWALYFWTKPLYHCTGEAADLMRMKKRAFIDGSFWWMGMACIYPYATGDSKVLVGIIVTGAVALGTFGYSRSAGPGMIYLAATCLGSGAAAFMTGLTVGTSSDLFVPFLSIFAFIALSKSVLERARANLQSFENLEKLSEKSEAVELLLKNYEAQATEWLWQSDAAGHLTVAPDFVFGLLGKTDDVTDDQSLLQHLTQKISPESAGDLERMVETIRSREEFHDIVLAFPNRENGGLRWVAVKGRPQFDNGVFQGFRGIVADTTQAVEAERQVQYLAAFDSLTGLLNRNSVQDRLDSLDREKDRTTAFLIDLDGFKQINDSYGHGIGDALLQAASKRLRTITAGDGWAARLAGDEFLIVLPDDEIVSSEDRLTFGQEVCDFLSEPFQIDDFELQISTSVGIARFPVDTDTGHQLLSLCDLALYDAKKNGRGRARLFNPVMLEQLDARIAVIEPLKRAVRNEIIELHYQPQHRLSDGSLIGFEALARWTDDQLGRVGPDVFIPIAEQTGLIVELGEQLLRRACTDGHRWFEVLGSRAPVVSVNISPVQFSRTDVAGMIAAILADTRLPAELLEIEVTESVLISDKSRVANTLKDLSAMGVSIALDDFGTGYSSLSYLEALPLNRLKIDRSFVNDLSKNTNSSIISAVIQLGHNLGLQVIAEGVETEPQLDQLLDIGCDEAQGYYFSRPMPVEDVNGYISDFVATLEVSKTG